MYYLNFLDIKKLEFEYDMIDIPNEDNAMGYYKIRQQLQKLSEELLQFIHQPKYLLPYLQPGRLVHVSAFIHFLNFIYLVTPSIFFNSSIHSFAYLRTHSTI